MDELLQEQIQKNKNTLLPKVGAFINAGGKIIFNEHLKYNDGTLAKEWASQQDTDREQANQEVEAFGEKVLEQLEKEGSYKLGELGRLVRDEDGSLKFENPGEESAGKGSPKKESKKETQESSKMASNTNKGKEEKKGSSSAASGSASQESGTKSSSSSEKEEKNKAKEKQAAKDSSGSSTKSSKGSKKKEARKDQKDGGSEKKKKGNKKPVIIALAIGIPITAILIYGILNFEKVLDRWGIEEKVVVQEENAEASDDKASGDNGNEGTGDQAGSSDGKGDGMAAGAAGAKKDTSSGEKKDMKGKEKEEKESSGKEKPEEKAKGGGKDNEGKNDRNRAKDAPYHIVVGCFENPSNAEQLVKKLKGQGYDAKEFGKIGRLKAVSAGNYSNRDEAVKELRKVQGSIEPEAWILER